jgi:lipopolysaccharide transport system permease protein
MRLPAGTIVIRSRQTPGLSELREAWEYRELLLFLAWRDIRVRYAQTFIGASWALIEPLVSVLAFTLIFNRVAGLESGTVPYPIFVFSGVLLWTFFSRALRDVTRSCVANAPLLRKIYFPRAVLPGSAIITSVIDFCCALLMFFVLCFILGVMPTWHIVTIPIWVALAGVIALGIGLALSAVNVYYRDVSQALPFAIQIWMLLSPVAYPLEQMKSSLPHWAYQLYVLNPLVGVVEGMRWAVLPDYALNTTLLLPSVILGLAALAVGLWIFQRAVRSFADVI